MNNQRLSIFKNLFSLILLAGIPTVLLSAVLFLQINQQVQSFQGDWKFQSLFWGIGIIAGLLLYRMRFRFFLLALLIYLIGELAFNFINQLPLSEAFAFSWTLNFYLYGGLMFGGFIVGFSVIKWRSCTIVWILVLIGVQSLLLLKSNAHIAASRIAAIYLLWFFYAGYLLYVTELFRKNPLWEATGKLFYLRKTFLAFIILLVLTILIGFIFKQKFDQLAETLSQGHFDQKSNTTSMTKQNKDGSLSNNNRMDLTGGLNKGKNLVFVAHLNNFLEDGKTPNPLYFTAFYYTKFDSASQSFLSDDDMPSNDLFRPNPSSIPLYFNKIDSTVIANSKGTLKRKVLNTEVYKVSLSPEEFVAPSTAFLCQPISVPKEYQGQFKSAYRAQMWTSTLNSAYFVYNAGEDLGMQMFQQERFNELAKAAPYSSEDAKFLNYYTQYPNGSRYDKIKELAHQLGDHESTSIGKMLAIRNFFLQKDENGKPTFQYSDNPGIPGIPNASKLDYFLFQNKKGYCAYYAGATLLMLRALGVPSRIVAGFMAVDRSSKNPGWYWFYADQAHAWVQVFFPGYGWMDFDTTIPDVNTQQAPQPDGTPPLGNLQTYFVADGNISGIDKQSKQVSIQLKHFIIQQKTFDAPASTTIKLDASLAKISADSGTVNFSELQNGMHITAASSAEALKNLKNNISTQPDELLSQLPSIVPVDEIRITLKEQQKKSSNLSNEDEQSTTSWHTWLYILAGALLLVVLLFYSIPIIILFFLKKKAKNSLYYNYQASLFYLYQMDYAMEEESPDHFANRIDKAFHTDYAKFSTIYQKYKYGNTALSQEEQAFARDYLPKFISQIKQKITGKERWEKMLRPTRAIAFFSKNNK